MSKNPDLNRASKKRKQEQAQENNVNPKRKASVLNQQPERVPNTENKRPRIEFKIEPTEVDGLVREIKEFMNNQILMALIMAQVQEQQPDFNTSDFDSHKALALKFVDRAADELKSRSLEKPVNEILAIVENIIDDVMNDQK